MAVKRKRFAEG